MDNPGLITLTMNPAIDISTSVDHVIPVRKLRCAPARQHPGGGGINVARVARRFGMNVLAIYTTGGPHGELLRSLVAREGIEGRPVPMTGNTREDFTVLDEGSGEQYRFVLPGPPLNEDEWKVCLTAIGAFTTYSGVIVASGSLPPDVPDDFYGRVALRARTSGAKLVLDTSRKPLAAALDVGVYLVKPNLRELRGLTGLALDSEQSWLDACRDLVIRGQAEIVALTLADRGAVVVSRHQAWRAQAPAIKPLSTVGAGDSFLGAMVWSLTNGQALDEALRYGTAAGTAALLSPGTDLCRKEDVERLLPLVTLQRL